MKKKFNKKNLKKNPGKSGKIEQKKRKKSRFLKLRQKMKENLRISNSSLAQTNFQLSIDNSHSIDNQAKLFYLNKERK